MIRYTLSNPADSTAGDTGLLASDGSEMPDEWLVEELERYGCTHVARYTGATWYDDGLLEWEADLVGGELVKYETY